MEEGAKSLLLSCIAIEEEIPDSVIGVNCTLLLPPFVNFSWIGEVGISMEREAIAKVMQSGTSLRKGALMVVPLTSFKGEVLGILLCEKKLSAEVERAIEQSSTLSKPSNAASISLLLMSESDEEVIANYALVALCIIEKLDCMAEAYQGIQQASLALSALQKVNADMEDKLAKSFAQRAVAEEAMKAGFDVLSLSLARR